MRIAVISDVHSTAAPFRIALEEAREEGFDQLVLLGDLFTYGIDPGECLDLALEAIDRDGACLVGGNHEQLYIDLRDQRSGYVDRLPEWIRESVEWTWRELGEAWPAGLEWVQEWTSGPLLMAHANPFGYGDWTYLADEKRLRRAAETLRDRGFCWGVFGHLHRPQFFRNRDGVEVHVVNSVGQPRSGPTAEPSWTMIELCGSKLTIEDRRVDLNISAVRSRIHAAAGLSTTTKSMLCRFYS